MRAGTSNFIPNQPIAANPYGNNGSGAFGIRNPLVPYNPVLNPQPPSGGTTIDNPGGVISNPGTRTGGMTGAYNGNFDPSTGWGVPAGPGRGSSSGITPPMSAYNPAYDPSAQFGWGQGPGGGTGATGTGKGAKNIGGYGGGGGGQWWNNPGMTDQTRALAPLYAQSSGLPGYLQKIIGRQTQSGNTMGQGMPGITV